MSDDDGSWAVPHQGMPFVHLEVDAEPGSIADLAGYEAVLCGGGARIDRTRDESLVTCPECLLRLKRRRWRAGLRGGLTPPAAR